MRSTFDAASSDPSGKDWSPLLQQYVTDLALDQMLFSLKGHAEHGAHQAGQRWAAATITKITAVDVYIAECIDLSNMDAIDEGGASIFAAEHSSRIRAESIVGYFENIGWLVVVEKLSDPVQTC